nr:hypothetical protein Iba_chr06eCG5800 [Ipomoea batatas]
MFLKLNNIPQYSTKCAGLDGDLLGYFQIITQNIDTATITYMLTAYNLEKLSPQRTGDTTSDMRLSTGNITIEDALAFSGCLSRSAASWKRFDDTSSGEDLFVAGDEPLGSASSHFLSSDLWNKRQRTKAPYTGECHQGLVQWHDIHALSNLTSGLTSLNSPVFACGLPVTSFCGSVAPSTIRILPIQRAKEEPFWIICWNESPKVTDLQFSGKESEDTPNAMPLSSNE